jgi:hypothetical protein
MKRKRVLISFFICALLTGCGGGRKSDSKLVENDLFLSEKSQILTNLTNSLREVPSLCYLLDTDINCNWGATIADSLLKTIDLSGKNYYHDCSKIFSAYTHIFIGCSYSDADSGPVYAELAKNNFTYNFRPAGKGEPKSKEELEFDEKMNKLWGFDRIVEPITEFIPKQFLKTELQVAYSFLFFMEVRNLNTADFSERYYKCQDYINKQFSRLPENEAFKSSSLYNQSILYGALAIFTLFVYAESTENFTKRIDILDKKFSSIYDYLHADNPVLLDEYYWQAMVKSSEVQRDILKIAVEQMQIINNQLQE